MVTQLSLGARRGSNPGGVGVSPTLRRGFPDAVGVSASLRRGFSDTVGVGTPESEGATRRWGPARGESRPRGERGPTRGRAEGTGGSLIQAILIPAVRVSGEVRNLFNSFKLTLIPASASFLAERSPSLLTFLRESWAFSSEPFTLIPASASFWRSSQPL